tara:strand:+ start:3149 stop:4183 length:1035 start_codon:yes stop_codon:yes gene_type:complete
MIRSMRQEIIQRRNYLNNKIVSSIYFGGGTPSILSPIEIKKFINDISKFYLVSSNAEITIECNPDDLTKKKLLSFKKIGINRLSIGVQSFHDSDLKFMNRSHSSKDAIKSIHLAKKTGFKNITIDLIYGLPNQKVQDWENNLDILFSLDIQHFSAYSLTVESKTPLSHLVKTQKVMMLSDEKIIEQFNLLQIKASEKGFIHYEISNFGKEGHFSRHNTAYWKNHNYLGIGPSAHSFNGKTRRWNTSSNKKYISNIASKTSYFELEELNITQQYNEYILTSLRTIWGVNINLIKESYGNHFEVYFLKQVKKWTQKKFITVDSNIYKLTASGKVLADTIVSDLFFA